MQTTEAQEERLERQEVALLFRGTTPGWETGTEAPRGDNGGDLLWPFAILMLDYEANTGEVRSDEQALRKQGQVSSVCPDAAAGRGHTPLASGSRRRGPRCR